MSKRVRRRAFGDWRIISFAIIAILFCLPVWIIYGDIHRTERSNAAHDEQRASFVQCFEAGNGVAKTECLSRATSTQYQNTAIYYDLKAQQDMAKWTLIMLIVTSVGVVFVALTLREAKEATYAAQEAVEVTRDMGARQSRAYLQADKFRLHNFKLGEVPVFEFRIKNFGQTTARQIECYVSMGYHNFEDDDKRFGLKDFVSSGEPFFLAPTNDTRSKIPFGDSITEKFRDDIRYQVLVQHFWGYIRYKDVFGTLRRLVFCVQLLPDSLTDQGSAELIKAERHNRAT